MNIAVILTLFLFLFSFFNARKLNFMKNARKVHLIVGACLCNFLAKLILYVSEKLQKKKKKKKNTVSFPGKTPL